MSAKPKIPSPRTKRAAANAPQDAPGSRALVPQPSRPGRPPRCVAAHVIDSGDRFEELRVYYLREFQPRNRIEADLVAQLVLDRWRLERLRAIETALLDLEVFNRHLGIRSDPLEDAAQRQRLALAFRAFADDSRSLALLRRHQARLSRACRRAIASLRSLRQADPKSPNQLLW